jgi:NAD(P)-dependent dehydrogenase (short-subunit alcohol dehydrogenase family)
MASASKVVFILGAGPRIGISVAKRFLKDGYKVAIGKRNPRTLQDPELKDMYSVAVDVSQPSSVASAFKEVTENLGIPQLVVYNGEKLWQCSRGHLSLAVISNSIILAAATFPADPTNPFTIAPDAFQQDIAVNATGAYAALYHATSRFLQLKEQDRTVALDLLQLEI